MKKIALLYFIAMCSIANSEQISNERLAQIFLNHFPKLTQMNHDDQSLIAANGMSKFSPSALLFPRNEADVLSIIDFYLTLKSKHPHIPPMVVSGGGNQRAKKLAQGWSFDAHAQGDEGAIVINTKNLSGLVHGIDWSKDFDQKTGLLKVWFYAGTTWRNVIDTVNTLYASEYNQEHYFVPIVSPTGGDVSIGGSFASNSHTRATSISRNYFADTVAAFHLASNRNGSANLIPASSSMNNDLFNTLIGSFGRGGIVTAIQLKLQRVSAKKNVITKIKPMRSMAELMYNMRNSIHQLTYKAVTSENEHELFPFLATGGIITADFKHFFLFENDFEETTDSHPQFPLFTAPDCKTSMVHSFARKHPKLAQKYMVKYFNYHASSNILSFLCAKPKIGSQAIFHNRPLNNYIFFQDGFTKTYQSKIDGGFKTGHLTMILKFNSLLRVMNVIKAISAQEKFESIHLELQDVLPLPKTDVLMAPCHSHGVNSLFIAYSISFAVNHKNQHVADEFKQEIEKTLYETKINNQPLAWLHPLKEFDNFISHSFYEKNAAQLEGILNSYGIDDQVIISNNIQKLLYKNIARKKMIRSWIHSSMSP